MFFSLTTEQVSAKVLTSENGNIDVLKGEVVNDDLFVAAQGTTINGTIYGDVFIGAQTVQIGGIINGNLHIGAQTVNISSAVVKGSIYIGSQTLTITSSKIGGSLLSGSQSMSIDKSSSVGGSIIAGAANINIDSQIKRNVMVGAGVLTIGDETVIGKDLYYAAGQENMASISEKAVVTGAIHKTDTTNAQKEMQTARKESSSLFTGIKYIGMLSSLIGALLVGLIFMNFFGTNLEETAKLVSTSFWKSMGVGFLVTISLIPGLIILLITVIGIPIAGLAILMFALYAYLAKIVVGSALGNWMAVKFDWKMSSFSTLALGLFVVYLFKLIPLFGPILGIAVFWVGLGAFTIRIFSPKSN
jgi:hypothetical protein